MKLLRRLTTYLSSDYDIVEYAIFNMHILQEYIIVKLHCST